MENPILNLSPKQMSSTMSVIEDAIESYEAAKPTARMNSFEYAPNDSLLNFIRRLLESSIPMGRLDPAYDLGGRAHVIKTAIADYLEQHQYDLSSDQVGALLWVYEQVENHDLDQIESDGIRAEIAPSVHSILDVRRSRLSAFRRRWESVCS